MRQGYGKIYKQIETTVFMRNLLVGAWIYAAAFGASALSLGGSHGTVVLGSTIDLTFEVRPDPGKTVASSCLGARLVLGATTVPETRVHVTPLEGGAIPMVRVQALIPVDEPVLTATLTAGCEGRVSRTYTFLADPPGTAPPAARQPIDLSRLAVPAPRAAPQVRNALGGEGEGARTVRGPRVQPRVPAASTHAPAERAARPSRAAKTATTLRTSAKASPPAAAAAPSRLVMEPLDLGPDNAFALQLTREPPQMSPRPSEALRAESAAWWQALDTSTAQTQRFEERLKRLKADAAAQGQLVERERATAAELRERLAQVESQGFPATVVYMLAGLLVLALVCIAWLLRRTRREALQAWRDSVALSGGLRDGAVAAEGPDGKLRLQVEPDARDVWQPTAPPPQGPDSGPLPLAPTAAPVSAPAAAPGPAVAAPAVEPLQARAQSGVQPESLFDLQQQAEFFTSVGEHEQAIHVLRQYIAQHGEDSPLAHLELLRLYHQLGRTDSFDGLRAQVEERFNVRVPPFAQFQQLGRSLEEHPEALARVEAAWSSPEVLAVLEGLLFHRGQTQGEGPFDLAALDDLLLLLSIAQTTPAHLRGAPPPRARTTPRATPALHPMGAQDGTGRSLDSMSAGLALLPVDDGSPASTCAAAVDVDVSGPPHITLSDLPPVPVTPAPAQGQAVGFGMENDKLELRFELEQSQKNHF